MATDASAEDAPARPICPNCMFPIQQRDDFCSNCQAPVGFTATIDPIKRIWAEGFFYKRAAKGPINGYMLVALWLMFAAPVLGPVLIIDSFDFDWPGIAGYFFSIFFAILYFLLLIKITLNYLRVRKERIDEADAEEDISD